MHQTKYAESSLIVKIFTEEYGLQSYMLKGRGGKNSKLKFNLFQPLSLLELQVNHREQRGIQYLSDCKSFLQAYSDNMVKNALVLFLNEVMYKSLKEENVNKPLFEFCWNSIQILDLSEKVSGLFHIYFMIQMSRYLGFYPGGTYSEVNKYFYLNDGIFKAEIPTNDTYLKPEAAKIFSDLLLTESYSELEKIKTSVETKHHLLDKMLVYYKLHIQNFQEIKSHKIFEEIFS